MALANVRNYQSSQPNQKLVATLELAQQRQKSINDINRSINCGFGKSGK